MNVWDQKQIFRSKNGVFIFLIIWLLPNISFGYFLDTKNNGILNSVLFGQQSAPPSIIKKSQPHSIGKNYTTTKSENFVIYYNPEKTSLEFINNLLQHAESQLTKQCLSDPLCQKPNGKITIIYYPTFDDYIKIGGNNPNSGGGQTSPERKVFSFTDEYKFDDGLVIHQNPEDMVSHELCHILQTCSHIPWIIEGLAANKESTDGQKKYLEWSINDYQNSKNRGVYSLKALLQLHPSYINIKPNEQQLTIGNSGYMSYSFVNFLIEKKGGLKKFTDFVKTIDQKGISGSTPSRETLQRIPNLLSNYYKTNINYLEKEWREWEPIRLKKLEEKIKKESSK